MAKVAQQQTDCEDTQHMTCYDSQIAFVRLQYLLQQIFPNPRCIAKITMEGQCAL